MRLQVNSARDVALLAAAERTRPESAHGGSSMHYRRRRAGIFGGRCDSDWKQTERVHKRGGSG